MSEPGGGVPAPASDDNESRELALLRLVQHYRGQAWWHELETSLARLPVPRVPSMMKMLKALAAGGFVISTPREGKSDVWSLTEKGERFLDDADRRRWPVGPLEAEEIARELVGDLPRRLEAIQPFMEDRARLAALLRQLLASGADAESVAGAAMYLDEARRADLAREWLADPRPEVRAAPLRAWAPLERDAPGRGWRAQPDAEWDALIRAGLLDPDPGVREAAARLAYGTGRAAAVVGELLVNTGAPERGLRDWAVLALGGADDAISRDVLRDLLSGDDEELAGVAVRALAARPDGHGALREALDDPREKIRAAAAFALAHVARGLPEAEIARLERDPRAAVRDAVSAYRARAASPPAGDGR